LCEAFDTGIVGYKIACTNRQAQEMLHVDEPFSGRLLSRFCFESPAKVDADQFLMRVIEPEFGFRLKSDLPASPVPRTREEVAEAVAGVLPALEIVDSRYTSWTTIGAPSLIADNACNAAWVHGRVIEDWRGIDLAAQWVRLEANGVRVQEGSGSAVLGHPLNALLWLVNHLGTRGIDMKAGQWVTTGITTDVYYAQPGDRIVGDFGAVGKVELSF
jgi:2-keto-4-pentenoate hydratase